MAGDQDNKLHRQGPNPEGSEHAREEFVRLLTTEQLPLQYYITKLLGDPAAAQQVLQETNVVLWRKWTDFQPGTNFRAWTRKVAYWQVHSYVRDRKRDRHVFGDELVQQLAARDQQVTVKEEEIIALRHCLQCLSQANVDMLRARYEDSLPIKCIAERVGKSADAVRVAMMRLRRSLQSCVERQLSEHQ